MSQIPLNTMEEEREVKLGGLNNLQRFKREITAQYLVLNVCRPGDQILPLAAHMCLLWLYGHHPCRMQESVQGSQEAMALRAGGGWGVSVSGN